MEAKSYVCRSYRRKTGRRNPFYPPPPILNTVFIPKYFYDKDTDDNNGNNKNDNNINNYNDNNNDDDNDNKEFITHFSRSTFFIFSNKRIKLAPSQL